MAKSRGNRRRLYDLYRGDTWQMNGDYQEIADYTGLSVTTVKGYASAKYHATIDSRITDKTWRLESTGFESLRVMRAKSMDAKETKAYVVELEQALRECKNLAVEIQEDEANYRTSNRPARIIAQVEMVVGQDE